MSEFWVLDFMSNPSSAKNLQKSERVEVKSPRELGSTEGSTDDKPLTSKDVGAMLGRNAKTIERHAREGAIPAHFKLNRWYFFRAEIDEWLRCEVKSTRQPDRGN
jgi:hypothetical protein